MNRRTRFAFWVILFLFTLSYFVWRIGWTLPKGRGAFALICALLLLAAELLGAFEMLFQLLSEGRRETPEKREPGRLSLPDVDVLVTTCGEPAELVRRTLTGCKNMKYEENKVHILLCDDADREEMRLLAQELGVSYTARKERENAKAGNLNAALRLTDSPLVAVFDADMCPRPYFLQATVPYLTGRRGREAVVSGRAGFVQTPQHFRNPDLFQKAFRDWETVPNEQDYFYHSIEVSRNAHNAVILAGSNMLLSRKALTDAGGFVTGTLTEDFATGVEIQKRGYRCVALPGSMADGLAPESLSALIRQRRRWARGCIQSGRKTRLLTAKGLSLSQRLLYLLSVHYWHFPLIRLLYLLAPLLYALFGVPVMRCGIPGLLIFWLPMFLCTALGIRLFSDSGRTVFWSWFYEICLTPFLLIPVTLELLGFRKKEFQVTDKSGAKGFRWWYPLPHGAALAVSAYALYRAVELCVINATWTYLPLVLWLVFHLYLLLCGFFFTLACRVPVKSLPGDPAHDLRGHPFQRTILLRLIAAALFRKNKEGMK